MVLLQLTVVAENSLFLKMMNIIKTYNGEHMQMKIGLLIAIQALLKLGLSIPIFKERIQ